jgi:hypothetical protein
MDLWDVLNHVWTVVEISLWLITLCYWVFILGDKFAWAGTICRQGSSQACTFSQVITYCEQALVQPNGLCSQRILCRHDIWAWLQFMMIGAIYRQELCVDDALHVGVAWCMITHFCVCVLLISRHCIRMGDLCRHTLCAHKHIICIFHRWMLCAGSCFHNWVFYVSSHFAIHVSGNFV